jgi:hypothetical protein
MPLFEVAITQDAKKTKDGTEPETLVLAPTWILAPNEQQAAMQTAIKHAASLVDVDQDRMRVHVRPF